MRDRKMFLHEFSALAIQFFSAVAESASNFHFESGNMEYKFTINLIFDLCINAEAKLKRQMLHKNPKDAARTGACKLF